MSEVVRVARQAIAWAHSALAAEDAGHHRACAADAAQARSAANLALYYDPAHPEAVEADRWADIAEDAATLAAGCGTV